MLKGFAFEYNGLQWFIMGLQLFAFGLQCFRNGFHYLWDCLNNTDEPEQCTVQYLQSTVVNRSHSNVEVKVLILSHSSNISSVNVTTISKQCQLNERLLIKPFTGKG